MISVPPFLRSQLAAAFEERRGYIAIVDALEQTEATDIRLMQRVVVRVVARHDSANDLAVFPSQK